MSCDIFVSYSTDVPPEIFDEVVRYFRGIEQEVYYYSSDNGGYGEDLKESLEKKIKDCCLLVVIVTEKAVDSTWVKFEIDCASKYGKNIIALSHYEFSQEKIPEVLRNRKMVKYETVVGLPARLETIRETLGYTAYIPGGGFGGGMIEFCTEVPKALCYIGDKPMLFHVIDALETSPFRKVVVINQESHAHEFIEYRTRTEYSGHRTLGSHSDNGVRYTGEVKCVKTTKKFWPQALKELEPKDTFLVNMCDVILSFNEDASTSDAEILRRHWKRALREHKDKRVETENEVEKEFLGTLITCEYFTLAAGIIEEQEPGALGEIIKVKENPKTPVSLTMNTGVAILEPGILKHVRDDDESLLGGPIERLCNDNPRKGIFIGFEWFHWYHIMHPIDMKTLHDRRLKIVWPR